MKYRSITVRFADSFTDKTLPGIKMDFVSDRVKLMRGEIREWIIYIKPFIEDAYRRTDRLHGKLMTKITFNQ